MTTFQSFLMGGFECSSHRRPDGVRLDLLASSMHERFASRDYAQLAQHGMTTIRDGVRWHRVEATPGRLDWSSVMPMLRAAQRTGVQVVWDLCHYGWPDDLDIWSAAFVDRFARFAKAFATVVRDQSGGGGVYCPVNEISYWAWAGGEVGRMNPVAFGRGAELKRQLVRATIAAIDAIRTADAQARFTVAEPLIHVVSGSSQRGDVEAAELYRRAQFEVHDMLVGRLAPELGGSPAYLDLVGANFYPDNQWYLHGPTIPFGHHSYRALSSLLRELHERYDRPVWIAETGAEGGAKQYWLHHVCGEVRAALRDGVQVEGICIYPVADYHGWENDRVCSVGLLSMPDSNGVRSVCPRLRAELSAQQALFAAPPVPDRAARARYA